MDLWTDGNLIVQHCGTSNEIRLYRDGAMVKSAPGNGRWKSPLTVDVEQNTILMGTPGMSLPCGLVALDLQTLEKKGEYDLECYRVVALGAGRVAAVVRQNGSPVFVVGRLGEPWEVELLLDEGIKERASRLPTMTDESPQQRLFGGDVRLTATEHGVAMADGQAGLVALWRNGEKDFFATYVGGASNETELTAFVTEKGMVSVARWAARESMVSYLDHQGTVRPIGSEHSYGAIAGITGNEVFVYDENQRGARVGRFSLPDLEPNATPGGRVREFVEAGMAANDCLVLGFKQGVYVFRVKDGAVVEETIKAGSFYDVHAVFGDDSFPQMFTSLCFEFGLQGYEGGLLQEDGTRRYTIRNLKKEKANGLSDKLTAAGAKVELKSDSP